MDDVFYQPDAFGPYGRSQDRSSDEFYSAYDLSKVPLDDPSMDPFYKSTAYRLAKQDNEWNEAMLDKILAHDEYMSNTAVQRAHKDYRAAGLNPYLAYSLGGASTPTGTLPASSGYSSAYSASRSANAKDKQSSANLVRAIGTIAFSAMALMALA